MTATPTPDTATTKVRKFPCEGCGADVRWDPGAHALKCPYCGREKQLVAQTGVAERPVEAALREPRDFGWGAERKMVSCNRCGAHTTLAPNVAAASCPFCGTAAVVEAPPNAAVVRPEGLLPFQVTDHQAREQFRGWLASLWFRPNDLKAQGSLTRLQGVYVPFWTFDAATHSSWTAMAGYHYYVNVDVRENGQTVTRREQRTRWEPASGIVDLAFDDVPVPASRGLDQELSRAIEPFPTSKLIEYEPSYLSGFLAEENAIDLAEALETAKERMRGDIRNACIRKIPGDTYRDLEVKTTFSALAYKNALLPIWIAAYDYAGKPYRYIVNGVTGTASGTAPWSWVKIGLAIMAVLLIVLIVMIAKSQ